METTLTFGQCLPSETPPETARVSDVDGGRVVPISGRSHAALEDAARAITLYRLQERPAHG